MTLGYSKPLYILPFDHRASYMSGMFHFKAPLTDEQHAKVSDSKRLIYEGFQHALKQHVSFAGILPARARSKTLRQRAVGSPIRKPGAMAKQQARRHGAQDVDRYRIDDWGRL